MPWGLKRFQKTGDLHFVTFSCYRREPLLDAKTRRMFERALEMSRRRYGFCVFGYVVMPEHVHLLLSEPERDMLATAIQAMKQSVARHYPALPKTGVGRGTGTWTGHRHRTGYPLLGIPLLRFQCLDRAQAD
jgi:putative transposase